MSDLEKIQKDLDAAKQKVKDISLAYKQKFIKADGQELCEEPEKDEYLYSLVNYLFSYIESLEMAFSKYSYRHAEGHLPPILGAEKMQTALNKLGVGEDYEIRKPVIYASTIKESRLGKTITV